jgi:hypothetical protein
MLMDETAEAVSSQWSDGRAGGRGSAACGRMLAERSVRAVRVVVLDVLPKHYREVARSGDQKVIEAFATQGADPALNDRVRPRCPDRWCG